jgi:hypothetical protein
MHQLTTTTTTTPTITLTHTHTRTHTYTHTHLLHPSTTTTQFAVQVCRTYASPSPPFSAETVPTTPSYCYPRFAMCGAARERQELTTPKVSGVNVDQVKPRALESVERVRGVACSRSTASVVTQQTTTYSRALDAQLPRHVIFRCAPTTCHKKYSKHQLFFFFFFFFLFLPH